MSVLKKDLFARIPEGHPEEVKKLLADEMKDFHKKIIVLDDDPTGVQTVNGIHVYTDWSPESIADGFAEDNSIFFILTNSRAFSAAHTQEVHQTIAERVLAEAKKTGKDFMIISRSDSTLRGHYPLETDTLRKTLEGERHGLIDGEVLMPFFKEGGRFTIGNTHYVQEGDNLVPAGETEFAKDKTFGYTASDMGAYIEEKTKGAYKAADTTYISLEDLRGLRIDDIQKQLMAVTGFNKVIVNAVDYEDVQVFAIAMIRALKAGKNFLFRTAAAWPKVIGNVPDKALLQKEELIVKGNTNGGLIIIGSHVKKTTDQLNELKTCQQVKFIEFNHLLVLEPEKLEAELQRIVNKYFELAAKIGMVKASRKVADMYYEGKGLSGADYKKAFQYYKLAAAQNNPYAMYQIGMMYLRGEGVEPSKLDALTWLGSAVSAGYQKAKDDYKRVRDELQLEDIIPAAETL